MDSQKNSTPRRGVLSPISINVPTSSTAMGGKTGSAEEPHKLGEVLLSKEHKISGTSREEIGKLGTKRRAVFGVNSEEGPNKKQKEQTQDSLQDVGVLLRRSSEERSRDGQDLQEHRVSATMLQPSSLAADKRVDAEDSQRSSSAPSSPSSNGFSEAAVNEDSQITLPDDSQEQVRSAPVLTQAQLRQRAQAIKLRLRLASYKVRTNQIHIPISRLQVRTIGHDRFPSTRRYNQTPMSFTSSFDLPNIRVQQASAEKVRQPNPVSSSPPYIHCNTSHARKVDSPTKVEGEETREAFATPDLPRHRHGLLNPPQLGNAIWEDNSPGKELTSSVVKRGTADALLSLKHQR